MELHCSISLSFKQNTKIQHRCNILRNIFRQCARTY